MPLNREFLESLMAARNDMAARVEKLTTDVTLNGNQPGAGEIHNARVAGAKGHHADLIVLLDEYWRTHNAAE